MEIKTLKIRYCWQIHYLPFDITAQLTIKKAWEHRTAKAFGSKSSAPGSRTCSGGGGYALTRRKQLYSASLVPDGELRVDIKVNYFMKTSTTNIDKLLNKSFKPAH